MHRQRVVDDAVAGLHVPGQETIVGVVEFPVEHRAFLEAVGLGEREAVARHRGDRAVHAVPFVRSRDIDQPAGLPRHRRQGEPHRGHVTARQRPERQIVVPGRRHPRAGVLDEELVVEEPHLVEPHQPRRDLPRRRVADEIHERRIAPRHVGVGDHLAGLVVPRGQHGAGGVLQIGLDHGQHMVDPSAVELPADADRAILPIGANLVLRDGAERFPVHPDYSSVSRRRACASEI